MVPRTSALRRLARIGVVLALLVAPVVPAVATAGAAAAPLAAQDAAATSRTLTGPGGLSVTMTPDPSLGVRAGDHVRTTFSGLQPGYRVSTLGMCPTQLPAGVALTAATCSGRWSTGIDSPIDNNGATAALSTTSSTFPLYARPDGTLTVDFLVGAGTVNVGSPVNYPRAGGGVDADTTVVCDESHPCSIGFEIRQFQSVRWSALGDVVVRPSPPLTAGAAGCGAFDATTLSVAGPERSQTQAAAWNTGLCAGTGRALPANLVGQGEPDGLRALGDTADLTFAGSALLGSPADPAAPQPRVLTPVALNAVVLAEVGGIEVPSATRDDGQGTIVLPGDDGYDQARALPSGSPLALPSIQLTQADVAAILLHQYPQAPAGDDASSTALAASVRSHPGNRAALAPFAANGASLPLGLAPTTVYPTGADSTPAALSAQLQHTSTGVMVKPTLPGTVDDGTAGATVGPFTDFSAVVDSEGRYTRQTSNVGGLYTSIFGKDVPSSTGQATSCPELSPDIAQAGRRSCARFLVTDLVTATSLGLPVASIANASGDFVTPSATSLQAAAELGSLGADGLFTPDLDAGGSAYPLTFVEYAVTSATPLVTADCTPRPAAQAGVSAFAAYLVDGGQRSLAPGLAPLTPTLRALGSASVAAIGASPATTGPCAAATTPTGGAGSGTGASGTDLGLGGGFAAGSGAAGGAAGSALGQLPAVTAPDAAAVAAASSAEVATAAASVDVPTFGAAGPLGALAPLLGLVGLVALVSGAGVVSSQRLRGKSRREVAAWVRITFAPDSVGAHGRRGTAAGA